jgi:hypothetical protein
LAADGSVRHARRWLHVRREPGRLRRLRLLLEVRRRTVLLALRRPVGTVGVVGVSLHARVDLALRAHHARVHACHAKFVPAQGKHKNVTSR